MALVQSSGKVTFLRVHNRGTKFGPPADQIDVEVVVQLSSPRGKSFGFQLRDDAQRPARQGMLDLLRDTFNNGWIAVLDYEIAEGKKNGIIIRVAFKK
jgi:hypothetical protein